LNDFPRLYLSIDNCFASKRWTRPIDWMELVKKEFGIYFVEASADTECDPLYNGLEYMKDWIADVKKAEQKTGVKVANLYSGHGTYSTLGLCHTDGRVRDRIFTYWLKPMIDSAYKLNAGLGFFCHALPQHIVQNYSLFCTAKDELYRKLSEAATYAAEQYGINIGIEQMYSPHQIPWTLSGTEEMMRSIFTKYGKILYTTIDTGHQSGQHKFVIPSRELIYNEIETAKSTGNLRGLWLGTEKAYEYFFNAVDTPVKKRKQIINKIFQEIESHPNLFSKSEDCDTYKWIEKIGKYSPIIHLQQTDGTVSAHWPFTPELNKKGIISGRKFIDCLYKSFSKPDPPNMPDRVKKIYLTLEMFTGTSAINYDQIQDIKLSADYWRTIIPEDGMTLDEIYRKTGDKYA
jgi:D-erythrulose 1-phosphate 3-epimerase